MNEQTDSQLLRAYVERRSESAFAELVRRHVDLVYSAGLRMVCDSHLAEDVTQAAFVALAKNATQLTDRPVLSSWLHRTAQNIAAQTVRSDVRRRAREQEAAAMNQLLAAQSDASWEQIAPHLDAALGELSEPDRDALLLRYFERKSAREMAQVLGVSDEAAQKRVSRAVERLREFFAKRGITIGASGLVLVISTNAVQAAPVGLAVTICISAALAGTTVAASATATATKVIAITTLQKTLVIALVGAAVVAATGLYVTQQLKRDFAATGERNVVASTATHAGTTPAAAKMVVDDLAEDVLDRERNTAEEVAVDFDWRSVFSSTNAPPRLPRDVVENYLDGKGRDAASLLAAYHALADTNYLKEAAANFPADPKVQWTVLMGNPSPEERLKWLESFKASSPENALANFLLAGAYLNGHHTSESGPPRVFGTDKLSAREFLATSQAQAAIGELLEASRKPLFKDYLAESRLDEEALNLAAGRSPIQALLAARGWWQAVSPQAATLKAIGYDLEQLQKEYLNIGDTASAEHLTQIGLALAARLKGGDTGKIASNRLNGLGLEALLMRSWDPNTSYDFLGGKTPTEKLEEIHQQREEIKTLLPAAQSLIRQMTEADVLSYWERAWQFGDVEAARWLLKQYGANPRPAN